MAPFTPESTPELSRKIYFSESMEHCANKSQLCLKCQYGINNKGKHPKRQKAPKHQNTPKHQN